MTAEYKIGDKVVFKNSFVIGSKEHTGVIVSFEEHTMDIFNESTTIMVSYTIKSPTLTNLITTDFFWTILRKVEEEPNLLEERISTIEERLGVLDNHVKKYIVDKVEEDVLIDTGAFCSPLANVVKGDDGVVYYLFENGTYLILNG